MGKSSSMATKGIRPYQLKKW